jgi:hypothetical protein
MNRVTHNVLYLRTYVNGNVIGHAATGFVYERGGGYYLVTNYHVLSGLDPATGLCIGQHGRQPDEIELILGNLSDSVKPWRSRYPLIDDNSNELWSKHPEFAKNRSDVAIFPLPQDGGVRLAEPLNHIESSKDILVSPGTDAFVVGFPLGIHVQYFPIWKRASIASELSVQVDGQPKFLIDTATREGMSGSPVICYRQGAYMTNDGRYHILHGAGREYMQILGIYSGRLKVHNADEPFGAQIGVAWHIRLVDEIIDAIEGYTES